jgi:hypothetical protein
MDQGTDFAVAEILQPFVSEANHWMLEHHPVFQVYFYGHNLNIDKNAREYIGGARPSTAPRNSARFTASFP